MKTGKRCPVFAIGLFWMTNRCRARRLTTHHHLARAAWQLPLDLLGAGGDRCGVHILETDQPGARSRPTSLLSAVPAVAARIADEDVVRHRSLWSPVDCGWMRPTTLPILTALWTTPQCLRECGVSPEAALTVRILSLDGGGIKGGSRPRCWPRWKRTRAARRPITSASSPASTGGIIAIGLGWSLPADDL